MDETADTTGAEVIDFTALTADLVSAYVSNNNVPVTELPALIASTHAALARLGQGNATEAPAHEKCTPAQIRKSITPDALISFEDGRPYKTLRRHLAALGLTPETYREKWGLPRDYPMTAASYSETRSALAKSFGLGSRRREAAATTTEPAPSAAEKPKRPGRPRKAKEAAKS